MKKNKLTLGLSLTILVAFLGGGIAHATAGPSNKAANIVDPIQSQHKRLQTRHSARKEAAKRLKVVHQQQHQHELQNWAKAHQGYTGHGKAGGAI
jgi:hypothetical protein